MNVHDVIKPPSSSQQLVILVFIATWVQQHYLLIPINFLIVMNNKEFTASFGFRTGCAKPKEQMTTIYEEKILASKQKYKF